MLPDSFLGFIENAQVSAAKATLEIFSPEPDIKNLDKHLTEAIQELQKALELLK